MSEDKQKAQELRREGKSLKEICQILDRPIGTITVWCRGIKSPKSYHHKKGYRVYNKEVKANALQSLRDGEALEQVSLSSGIPSATLRQWCQKADIDIRQRNTYSDELREKAMELRESGMKYEEIQEELQIDSLHTLRNWFKN